MQQVRRAQVEPAVAAVVVADAALQPLFAARPGQQFGKLPRGEWLVVGVQQADRGPARDLAAGNPKQPRDAGTLVLDESPTIEHQYGIRRVVDESAEPLFGPATVRRRAVAHDQHRRGGDQDQAEQRQVDHRAAIAYRPVEAVGGVRVEVVQPPGATTVTRASIRRPSASYSTNRGCPDVPPAVAVTTGAGSR